MRLQLMSWPEVERYLESSKGIIVPIGATEQHGPIGMIGTDAICADSIARGVGDATGAVVAPALPMGMSEHHMAFPGTVTLRPSTLLSVVRDVVVSLARHGFRRIWFLNGHGGNTATVEAAFFEAYDHANSRFDDGHDLRCSVAAWWECGAAEALSLELFGDRDGDHATPSELSLALAAEPTHRLPAADLTEPAGCAPIYGCEDFRRQHPDGRMGSASSLASRDHGHRIRDAVIAELAEQYRAFVGGD